MFFGLGKSTDTSRAGVGFNWKEGFGVTAYNATYGKLNLGDCVVLHCTGTSGQEWKATQPTAARSTYGMFGVALETIEYQKIGKFLIYGKAQARVLGHASLTGANKYLELLPYKYFDGTATHIAFVAGSGTTRDTITDSDNGFVTDGFLAGMQIVVYGSTSNDGTYEIYSVDAGTITLTTIGALTSEAGVSGMTLASHGYLQYDGTSDTANSWAVSREAYTTTSKVALKYVQLQGLPKILASS